MNQVAPTTTSPAPATTGETQSGPPEIVVEKGLERIWAQVKLALGQDIRIKRFQPDPCEERPGVGNHPANLNTDDDWNRGVIQATTTESVRLGRLLLHRQKEKLETGTYGKCDGCHQEIPSGRLESRLEAVACCPCYPKVVSDLERNRPDLYRLATQAIAA